MPGRGAPNGIRERARRHWRWRAGERRRPSLRGESRGGGARKLGDGHDLPVLRRRRRQRLLVHLLELRGLRLGTGTAGLRLLLTKSRPELRLARGAPELSRAWEAAISHDHTGYGDGWWRSACKSNLRRVRAESSRRPARHRRDACSMAWWCWFLTARQSQDGRVIAEK